MKKRKKNTRKARKNRGEKRKPEKPKKHTDLFPEGVSKEEKELIEDALGILKRYSM